MSGDLTGKFNYTSLIQTLQDNGVNNTTSAARKVGNDNDIDNIKDIDGTEEITIAQSIFNGAFQTEEVNGYNSSVQAAQDESLLPYTGSDADALAMGKVMSDGGGVMELPEIYNDDDYDVVDYDEFYGFEDEDITQTSYTDETEETTDETTSDEEEAADEGLDFEAFKAQYGSTFVTDTISNQTSSDEILANIFNAFDQDSNDYIDDAELASGLYAFQQGQKKDTDTFDVIQNDGEDLIGDDMMNMDMQNDSFNPQ